ncbi:MAG TPA: response regulator [Syntrophobacteraceae bacterium]|nr:response regulator [Syntrophobacteraceae bacterium]
MRIVLVENDPVLLKTLEMLLRRQGCQVVAFHEPAMACAFLERGEHFDLLIIDYMMPELTGREVLERVRGRFPKGCRVVLISGHTDVVESLDLKAMGVDTFLPKPLDLKRLRQTISISSG